MHFLDHYPASDIQWHLYRRLELIPPSISNPKQGRTSFAFGLGWTWHRFIRLLIAELEAEGRLGEYFERCWALDMAVESEQDSNTLHQLWVLMD